jgi:nucleoside-diphosphate-sugar epimerase
LQWFGLTRHRDRVEALEADFLKLRCGLPKESRRFLRDAGAIIHCASDTRFNERSRSEATVANVESLKEILRVAEEISGAWFHYVSTAYAVGMTASPCLELPVTSQRFVNVYEETKARAEKEVARRCRDYGIPYTIIRPSIVYGDSRTGRANRFNALYTHVRALSAIRDIYRSDLDRYGGLKAAACGISTGPEGMLYLPLRLVLPQPGLLHLIPVDYFVAATLLILQVPEPGVIYHVTGQPITVEEIAAYCESFLKIRGIEIVHGDRVGKRSPAESIFYRFIEQYLPYLSDPRMFDRRNTDHATGGLVPPPLTYEIFERCMHYAVEMKWGC